MTTTTVERWYTMAKDRYAEWGVDCDAALNTLSRIPISIHCWQGDDVTGFEGSGALSGGILATGNFPGKARTPQELRADFEQACALIPGRHRFNLHAMYQEDGNAPVARDAIEPRHFQSWVDWARSIGIGLDFNPTCFSHPKAADGFTLSHRDKEIRDFWIEHVGRCRVIAASFGRQLSSPCMNNIWIPDGCKDHPADRLAHINWLIESLDRIFIKGENPLYSLDAVESKLFGLGSEVFVVGSHEFYLAYALSRKLVLTMDAGHYHPTESIAAKVSALLPFFPHLLLHVSRPERWDSDHVVLFDDPTRAIMREIARAEAWDRVRIALDFFDASINRIAAWVIGTRNTLKAILAALLEPIALIRRAEDEGRLADRLALQEEAKTLPFGAVWDRHCAMQECPFDRDWMEATARYERNVLRTR